MTETEELAYFNKKAYDAQRMREIRAGTWKPKRKPPNREETR